MIHLTIPFGRAPAVRDGRQIQLLVPVGTELPAPGDRIRLVTPVKSQIMPDPLCRAVDALHIEWQGYHIARVRQAGVPVLHLDRLAQACGYSGTTGLAAALLSMGKGEPLGSAFVIEWVSPEAMLMEMA